MYVTRQLYEADEAFARVYRLDGRYWPARIGRVLVMLKLVTQEKEMDQGDAALSEMQLLRRESGPFANYFPGLLVLCLARTGNTEEARRQLEIFTMSHAMDPVQKALAYLGLGGDRPGCPVAACRIRAFRPAAAVASFVARLRSVAGPQEISGTYPANESTRLQINSGRYAPRARPFVRLNPFSGILRLISRHASTARSSPVFRMWLVVSSAIKGKAVKTS